MTPKTKADPKVARKLVKKPAKMSSTLALITKLGGGLKAEGKSASVRVSMSKEADKRALTAMDIDQEDREGKRANDVMMNEGHEGDIKKDKEVEMASISTAGNHKEGTTDKDSGNVMAKGRIEMYKNRREVLDGEKMSEDEEEDDDPIKTSVELVDEC